jgi:transcriptional regulator with XRE-family HTH domain
MVVVTPRSVILDADTTLAELRRRLRITGREIERGAGLPRGVVSAVERGRLYPYPKFRRAVAGFLAAELDVDAAELDARLFRDAALETHEPALDGLEGSCDQNDEQGTRPPSGR